MLKIIIGGDGGVGKTTYLYKLCQGKFLTDTKMTVGVGFLTKNVKHGDTNYNLALWDFGGQDQFRFILTTYVKGAHAGLVFFSLDRATSFMSIDEWVELLRSEKPGLPLYLVGTKADLEDEDLQISGKEIREKMKEHGMIGYTRTSSKTGNGIDEPINKLVMYYHETFMS